MDSRSPWEKSELFERCRINHFRTGCPTKAASFYSWDNEKVTSPRMCACLSIVLLQVTTAHMVVVMSGVCHVYVVPVAPHSPVPRLIGSVEVETNYMFSFS